MFLQVVKAVARSMGFEVKERKNVRTNFQNFPGFRQNMQRRTASEVLRAKKLNVIANGELEAGKIIVPFTYEVLHVQEDETLVCNNNFLMRC